MKHRLYKITALTGTVAIVFTMGACSRNIKVGSIKPTEVSTNNTVSTTVKNIPTTFSIFEDPDLLTTSLIAVENQPIENLEKTTNIEDTTKKEITTTHASKRVDSRFSSQEELESYLTEVYLDSGKDYKQIINEFNEAQNDNYYIYRNDLYTSAAYMLLRDNGYTLNDLALELDYLLTVRINSRELIEEDVEALKPLYEVIKVFGDHAIEEISIYQLFEQLALERHKVSCEKKDEHEKGSRFITCDRLNEQDLYYNIINSRGETLSLS